MPAVSSYSRLPSPALFRGQWLSSEMRSCSHALRTMPFIQSHVCTVDTFSEAFLEHSHSAECLLSFWTVLDLWVVRALFVLPGWTSGTCPRRVAILQNAGVLPWAFPAVCAHRLSGSIEALWLGRGGCRPLPVPPPCFLSYFLPLLFQLARHGKGRYLHLGVFACIGLNCHR